MEQNPTSSTHPSSSSQLPQHRSNNHRNVSSPSKSSESSLSSLSIQRRKHSRTCCNNNNNNKQNFESSPSSSSSTSSSPTTSSPVVITAATATTTTTATTLEEGVDEFDMNEQLANDGFVVKQQLVRTPTSVIVRAMVNTGTSPFYRQLSSVRGEEEEEEEEVSLSVQSTASSPLLNSSRSDDDSGDHYFPVIIKFHAQEKPSTSHLTKFLKDFEIGSQLTWKTPNPTQPSTAHSIKINNSTHNSSKSYLSSQRSPRISSSLSSPSSGSNSPTTTTTTTTASANSIQQLRKIPSYGDQQQLLSSLDHTNNNTNNNNNHRLRERTDLSRHIVRYYELKKYGHCLAIVMEDFDATGLDLFMNQRRKELLQQQQRLQLQQHHLIYNNNQSHNNNRLIAPLEQLIDIGIQLSRALSFIHQCDLIHGGLTSANILIAPRREKSSRTVSPNFDQNQNGFRSDYIVKISDFGYCSQLKRERVSLTYFESLKTSYVYCNINIYYCCFAFISVHLHFCHMCCAVSKFFYLNVV